MKEIKNGDRGVDVYLLQYILKLLGYDVGNIDGIFGASTEEALKSFQQKMGLVPDGMVNPETSAALEPYLLGFQNYTVMQGDTIQSIAERFGASPMTLLTANPQVTTQDVEVGTTLVIPYGFDVVKTNVPYTSSVLEMDITGLQARYPFIDVTSIGQSVLGKPLYRIRLGKGDRAVSYNGSHHANEWITTPVLMKWIEEYLKSYVKKETLSGYDVVELWDDVTIDIVPMVNPDGVDLVIEGADNLSNKDQLIEWNYGRENFSDWKSNINGVDLNRNYDAAWKEYKNLEKDFGVTGPGPALYGGMAPGDQPESKAMIEMTRRGNYRLVIAYHTQGEVIFWSFMDLQPDESYRIAQEFSKVSGYALADPSLSQSFAGYKDWFIETYEKPGFTIEVGQGKNPLPLSQFGRIYDDNEELLLLAAVI